MVWVTQVLAFGGKEGSGHGVGTGKVPATVSGLSTLGGCRIGVLDPDGTSHWRVTRYRGTVFS